MKKLLIIHGLNNSIKAMKELGEAFSSCMKVSYLCLPHHGASVERFNLGEDLIEFSKELTKHLSEDTFILAYSLGCTYLQHALENKVIEHPLKRITYLSPALKTKFNLAWLRFLPHFFRIPSFAPRELRLRNYCYWGQYMTLHQLSMGLSLDFYPRIYADPQDELIDLTGLEYQKINRNYLSYGEHHLTIHPKYFKNDDWEKLIKEIIVRFQIET